MGSKERKRSKKASQGGKKKGDGKSRKKSTKKLLSHSESDDDLLISISSRSNSSEEDVVKGRQSRSHVRKDVKGKKRRARSSSCSSDSSFNSSVRVKKRKSSKREVGLGRRKKKDGKKYKREVSLSSTSSDKSDYKKLRGDSKKEKGKKYGKEEKNKRKKKRNRARSLSSSSESSASYYERKRKRYQSPSGSSLSMSSECEREGKRKRYWSPSRSSLSRDSKSSDQRVLDEIKVQNKPVRKLNSIVVISAAAEPDQNATSVGLEHVNDTRVDERSIIEKGENIEEKKSTTEAGGLVQGDEDLELILKLKALENLKRFRGGPKMSEKPEKMGMIVAGLNRIPVTENAADQESTVGCKHLLSSDTGPIQNDSDKDQVIDVKLASSSGKEKVLASKSVNNKNPSFKKKIEIETGGTKSAQFVEDSKPVIQKGDALNPPMTTDKSSTTDDEGISRHNFISQPSTISDVKDQSKSVLKSQGPLAACSVKDLKQYPKCINSKPVASKCGADISSSTLVNEVNDKSIGHINNKANIVKATVPGSPPSSIHVSTAGEHVSSSEQKEEDKEQSQFQEKTMTVMRGGELVQVSYKVYIPKKAPAASRRRLNR